MITRQAWQMDEGSWPETAPARGERALMQAVLRDALSCLAGEIGPLRERPRLATEARRWVVASDGRLPFSFEYICEALGIDAGVLRRRVLSDSPERPPAEQTAPTVSIAPSVRRDTPAPEDIVRMIRDGHPLRVVAETFGISISKASVLSCSLASRIKAERDQEIRRLRAAGWTHRALARHFGLSRIRVMRIGARRRAEVDIPARLLRAS